MIWGKILYHLDVLGWLVTDFLVGNNCDITSMHQTSTIILWQLPGIVHVGRGLCHNIAREKEETAIATRNKTQKQTTGSWLCAAVRNVFHKMENAYIKMLLTKNNIYYKYLCSLPHTPPLLPPSSSSSWIIRTCLYYPIHIFLRQWKREALCYTLTRLGCDELEWDYVQI